MIERFEIDTEQWAVVPKEFVRLVQEANDAATLGLSFESCAYLLKFAQQELLAAAPRPEAAHPEVAITPEMIVEAAQKEKASWTGDFKNAACHAIDGMVERITDNLLADEQQPAPRPVPTGRVHELKTDPDVFDDVVAQRKLFEIRLNDRDYRIGDELILRRTRYTGVQMRSVPTKPLEYVGAPLHATVTYVLHGPIYGLAKEWVIMGINPTGLTRPAAPDSIATCEWREDADGIWETACGEAWVCTEGTPVENDMKYCHSCGKHLKEMPCSAPDSGDVL